MAYYENISRCKKVFDVNLSRHTQAISWQNTADDVIPIDIMYLSCYYDGVERNKEIEVIMMITKIKGINGSYAVKDETGEWHIHGFNDILDEQEADELAYKIDQDFDNLKMLPRDTPVYASVNQFEGNLTSEDNTDNYADIDDLYSIARDILHDLSQDDFAEYGDKYILKSNVATDPKAQDEIAQVLFDQVTWQSYESYAQDIEDDICDAPNAYPELFK